MGQVNRSGETRLRLPKEVWHYKIVSRTVATPDQRWLWFRSTLFNAVDHQNGQPRFFFVFGGREILGCGVLFRFPFSKFESGKRVIDGTNFVVDNSLLQSQTSNQIFGQIGFDSAGLFRPGNPQSTIGNAGR